MNTLYRLVVTLFATVALISSSVSLALAHHERIIKKTTVTTTTTTTTTKVRKKHHHATHKVAKKRHKRHVKKQPRKVRTTKLGIKKERLFKPETKRHKHFVRDHHGHHIHVFPGTHQHGNYLPHTHSEDNIIHISPKAKRWPNPKPHAFMIETPRVPASAFGSDVDREALTLKLALVVRETQNGVTIIRNVKGNLAPGLPIRNEEVIGVTDLPKPNVFLTEEEIRDCQPRLKVVGGNKINIIKVEDARYCD